MASPAVTPQNPAPRRRGRPPGTTNAVRAARAAEAARLAAELGQSASSRKRRYVPGGPGGGGRFVDPDGLPGGGTPRTGLAPPSSRRRAAASRDISYAVSPVPLPRRDRSARTRATAGEDFEEIEWGSSAAAVAASVKQAEDYKPREERSWEEFHPNLDISQRFVVFAADEVDGVTAMRETPSTPSRQTPGTPLNGAMTPLRQVNPVSTGDTPIPQLQFDSGSQPDSQSAAGTMTPSRRSRRTVRESVSFYGVRATSTARTPRTPRILPISNQTPKEKLDLKQPSFRKTNRIELFESKTFGQARYVDKAMSNVGYQESDHFPRPDETLLRAIDLGAEDDAEQSLAYLPSKSEEHSNGGHAPHAQKLGRVEYDMDEQDDMWLEHYNAQRKQADLEPITREVFEITMTKIEKEWHALERRIPKPNPKPPQTHRPRSSSAAAVNGEIQSGGGGGGGVSGDEPDSKCVICDDGDCENTNAIVFCDGCNLAVHQECYGVPFIPEGQWLCRKCQLCGRGVPTCIFCPNTDGAFKQTNSSKWAHLLCAMWIPEISLGNHTFMEPVMDVEKVPKTRWKLNCYICRQKMGACIQCSNKNCYQAFHVTCARRSRLYLKMKTSHGALAVLDGSMVLKAFCHNHCPPDYTIENNIHQATRAAKKFYKRNMRGRIWADNQAMANVLAAQHRVAITDHSANDGQAPGRNSAMLGYGADEQTGQGQPPKNLWKLPSGAPIIPQAVYDVVEASIQRFPFRKRKDFLGEACRYWTLKREARRGAALLKRLQLQMEAFSSMELTRRDFASMGPSGRTRLARRIEFAENIVKDLERLKELSEDVVRREELRVEAVELENDFVDECYFPVAKMLEPAMEKAISLDKELFEKGLEGVSARVERRHYTTVMLFAQDLCEVISKGIRTSPPDDESSSASGSRFEGGGANTSLSRPSFLDIRERRKLGKRILKSVQPFLEGALKVEAVIGNKAPEALVAELEALIEASLDTSKPAEVTSEDTVMVDVQDAPEEITVKSLVVENVAEYDGPDAMDTAEDEVVHDNPEVESSGLGIVDATTLAAANSDKNLKAAATTTRGVGSLSSATPDDDGGGSGNDYAAALDQQHQKGPPTPPQSNGSLGGRRDHHHHPADPLTDGGVLWHVQCFEPRGTSALLESAAGVVVGGFDAARLLSEDLTDLDEVELKGRGADMALDEAEVAAEPERRTRSSRTKTGTTPPSPPRARRTSARHRS
ncbi:PHD finger domain-containing protein [Cordyceps fumosorosea ARSEF 2679]|uniref:PHD finger domain-containing protein n=1 Tax=Cordyceps fumosorosea (strain ARSEF 2679) TaxID=1081104 RepID=A0A168EJW7_CORFA|nr:PHD finger domain-containing protein [Cordyceps fumosorosea ARSEF 2679]OAA73903.1 PHD finger domain-containing protein [Cordyceps fumosorosea ARSEF 2679]